MPRRHRWQEGTFGLSRCRCCGLLRTNAPPGARTRRGEKLFYRYRQPGAPWFDGPAGTCLPPSQTSLFAIDEREEFEPLDPRLASLPESLRHPCVREALRVFPDAKIVSWSRGAES